MRRNALKEAGKMSELFPEIMAGSAAVRLLLATVYMGVCALQDFRSRTISLPLTVCAGGAAILLDLQMIARGGAAGVLLLAEGLLPGVLFLLLSEAAKGAAGKGDGYCLLVLGALCGPAAVWRAALAALFLASLCGIVLIAIRKAKRKTRLPFLLFAGLAWSGNVLCCLSGIEW